ncbi:MAG: MmcB family DNA repair protein [Alphaproteobacteria bacterium]|nr:MmcB family DNA repair protein [Alphaproteobacteria bacterium]
MQNNEAPLIYEGEALTRPDQTTILTRGVVRLFIELGLSPLLEFKLANGRRVDVAGLDRKGRLTVAEVKSCRADFECDGKWTDYLGFCDYFYFAVDPGFPLALLPASEGLILADAYGAMVNRPAQERVMAAARRKAVTLRFARQAARRICVE